MRIPHHLRRAPSGRWQFVQRVPVDLTAWFGKRWLKHMLTADLRAAQAGALALASRYAWAFHRLRVGDMAVDDEKALRAGLAALYGGNARTWEMEGTTPNGRAFKIKTDGTEHDNASAERAVAAMFDSEAYRNAVAFINAPIPSPEQASKTPPLEDQITLFFATEREGKLAQTMRNRRRVAEAFADFHEVGRRRPVGEISKAHAVAWLDHLATTEGLTKPTRANYASHLRVLFGWMTERGTIDKNPFERVGGLKPTEKKQRRAEGFGWEVFGVSTLRRMFAPESLGLARMDHVRWGAILGLYTGARVGELAQLLLCDFQTMEDVPYLKICTDGAGQRVKTEQSKRVVPLHPDLIRLGLLDEVARRRTAAHDAARAQAIDNGVDEKAAELQAAESADAAQFFAIRTDRANGKGDTISKGFTNLLAALSIAAKNETGTVGFHSFRKTMTQTLQGSSVSAERRRAFLGHEPGEGDSHGVVYMRPWTPEELAAVFEGIPFGAWLDVGGLRPVLASGQAGQRRAVKPRTAEKRVSGKKKKAKA